MYEAFMLGRKTQFDGRLPGDFPGGYSKLGEFPGGYSKRVQCKTVLYSERPKQFVGPGGCLIPTGQTSAAVAVLVFGCNNTITLIP